MKRFAGSTWLLVALFCVVFGVGGYSIGHTAREPAVETGTQLASQVTVLYPSTLTYVQQTALEKGTGLAGVDFIYVERQTGIDALTLMAIAADERIAAALEFQNILGLDNVEA